MRRFLASAWFPFLTALLLGGVSVAAYALLKPTPDNISNGEIIRAFTIAGWVAGPAVALIGWLLMMILNLLRRLLRIRKVNVFHPLVVILGIAPGVFLAMDLTIFENRYTPFARAAIDFVGRPLLWGSLAAAIFIVLMSLTLLFPKQK